MLSRECWRCGRSRVVSRRGAKLVFRSDTTIREALDSHPGWDGACTHCYTEAESE
jgi:hypothetical protein